MTELEAIEVMRAMLAKLREDFVPDESAEQSRGKLGFDYGYHHALSRVEIGLWSVFAPKPPPVNE